MAKPCLKCYAVLAIVVVVVLALTGVWNPWPGLWSWVNRNDPIAPGSAWQQQVDGSTRSVTVTGGAVVVEYRTRTEAFGLQAGVQLWEKNADWSAVAGTDRDAVVVTGELLTKGYEVLDPVSGVVRRSDPDAVAVWTYTNAVVDLRCLKAGDCELRAWDPRGSTPLWSVGTPGVGFVLSADNPALPRTRLTTGDEVDAGVAGPQQMPGLLGFPADNRLHVVDTAAGKVVRILDLDRRQRVAVAGNRVLTVDARSGDGTCYFTVTATDPVGGQRVWRTEGLNLRTAAGGAGCEQENDPVGGKDVVLGVTPAGREVLTDAHDGRTLWKGAGEQRVLGLDDRYALIRDGDTLLARDFAKGRTAWKRPLHTDAEATLTPHAAVLVDESPRRVLALDPATGVVRADVRTRAKVLAAGSGGLIVGEGRAIAYLPYTPAG